MAHTDPHASSHSPSVGHETTDASLGGVERFMAVLALFLAVSFGLMYLLFGVLANRAAERDPAPSPVAAREGDRLPPAPRLQTMPAMDLNQFRTAEDALLNNYGWVDERAGIARIPVSRAIEILAEQGLPSSAADTSREAGSPAAKPTEAQARPY